MVNERPIFNSAWAALGSLWLILAIPFVSQAGSSQKHSVDIPKAILEIPNGRFTPLFGLDKNQSFFPVNHFYIDRDPVTQENFEKFLTLKNSESWKKSSISPLFGDSKYLMNWNAEKPKFSNLKKPVIYVSWYAAAAYCEALKGRLPTTLEWEYVAAASEIQANAQKDAQFVKKILTWYTQPTGNYPLRNVGAGKPNFYGVRDLHGLIWEWTSDYNSSFITADNRQDGDKIKDLFCGAGATGAVNREDYAAFMRYAMRSSLSAHFSVANLGFRCAYDKK